MYYKAAKAVVLSLLGTSGAHFAAHSYIATEQGAAGLFERARSAVVARVAESAGYELPGPKLSELDARAVAEREALKWGVNPSLVRAMIHVESGWKRGAVSSAGALGYTQVMTTNAKRCGLKDWTALLDSQSNIACGVQILAEELRCQKGNVRKALWAYNAGAGRVGNPPAETVAYAENVLNVMAKDLG